jgi:hypothetical protein
MSDGIQYSIMNPNLSFKNTYRKKNTTLKAWILISLNGEKVTQISVNNWDYGIDFFGFFWKKVSGSIY